MTQKEIRLGIGIVNNYINYHTIIFVYQKDYFRYNFKMFYVAVDL